MVFTLPSVLGTSLINTTGHILHQNTDCFLSFDSLQLGISSAVVIIPYSLNGLGYMFLYVGIYEFICVQSPHAIKRNSHWYFLHHQKYLGNVCSDCSSLQLMGTFNIVPKLWFHLLILTNLNLTCTWAGGLHTGCK